MQRFRSHLSRFGEVETFDYDYMLAGKKRPDPPARLVLAHRRALESGRAKHGPDVVLAGKSMGGRIGCHVAQEEASLGVICFGYPLAGRGDTSRLRDQVLRDQARPTLFVQGTRDRLCPLPLLQQVLRERAGRSELCVVESGDHSLQCTKTFLKQQKISQAEIELGVMKTVGDFLATI